VTNLWSLAFVEEFKILSPLKAKNKPFV